MPKPYHIEKGREPPVKKRSDEEFDRAVEELQSLVRENKRLLSDYPLTIEHAYPLTP